MHSKTCFPQLHWKWTCRFIQVKLNDQWKSHRTLKAAMYSTFLNHFHRLICVYRNFTGREGLVCALTILLLLRNSTAPLSGESWKQDEYLKILISRNKACLFKSQWLGVKSTSGNKRTPLFEENDSLPSQLVRPWDRLDITCRQIFLFLICILSGFGCMCSVGRDLYSIICSYLQLTLTGPED